VHDTPAAGTLNLAAPVIGTGVQTAESMRQLVNPFQRESEMKKLLLAAALAVGFGAIQGCGGQGDALIGNTNPRVRLVNAFNQNVSGTVTDRQGTRTLLQGQPFGTISQFQIFNNGQNTVAFLDAATGANLAQRTFLQELNTTYSVVGFNGPGGDNNIIVLPDGTPPALRFASVRIANATQQPIDVYLTGVNGDPAPEVNDLPSGQASGFFGAMQGMQSLRITSADGGTILVDQNFNFVEGRIVTFVVGNNPNPTLITVDQTVASGPTKQ
jgi:hypothetical protein